MGIVNEYLAAARSMDAEQFVERFENPVLVQQGKADLGDPRNEYRSTLKMRIDHERGEVQIETSAPGPEDLVLEVKKSDRNSVQGKILVGRTETNDIPIPDITVSKHHAFIRIDENGDCWLSDAGSTNGTKLNGRPLAQGFSRQLRDGDQLIFGEVPFVFYTPSGFYELLRSLSVLR